MAASASHASEVDDLVKQGVELRRDGHDADALAVFRRAYAIEATPRVIAQIGLAEQALSKWVDAERDLLLALAKEEDPWIAKNVEPLRTALAAVQAHLGWLQVTCDVPGASLRVGGAELGEATLSPLRVVAESVSVEARKAGYAPVLVVVSVASGQHAKVELTMTPLPTVAAPPKPAVETPSRTGLSPRVGAGLIGAAVAGVVVGSYFGVRALHWKSERSSHCEGTECDSEGLTADRELRLASTASTIAFGAAAVTGIVGIVLVVPAFGRSNLSPVVASHGLGLSWRGAF